MYLIIVIVSLAPQNTIEQKRSRETNKEVMESKERGKQDKVVVKEKLRTVLVCVSVPLKKYISPINIYMRYGSNTRPGRYSD
jgi:hypothetical protein